MSKETREAPTLCVGDYTFVGNVPLATDDPWLPFNDETRTPYDGTEGLADFLKSVELRYPLGAASLSDTELFELGYRSAWVKTDALERMQNKLEEEYAYEEQMRFKAEREENIQRARRRKAKERYLEQRRDD